MHLHREVFAELSAVGTEHGELAQSYLWAYLQETYAASQASAIRRQADHDRRLCTLARLLAEIEDDPSGLTRRFYAEHYEGSERLAAERRFDEQLAGTTGSHLAPALVRRDRKVLAQVASNVVEQLESRPSPATARTEGERPALVDLDFPIDTITRLFNKYYEVLTGTTRTPALVAELDPNWLAALRVPWIRP